ncbi:MAG: tetratricopeptide repeat protein [Lentisphaeria bacterium]|nr:tetratricopeptide repeat protein [Lentisphaeria bacterium]
MFVIRLFVRLVRLPFDLVFLTLDCVRVGVYLGMGLFWKAAGRERPPFGPCLRSSFLEAQGEELSRCPLASRYGNPGLVRLLCSGVTTDPRVPDVGLCGCEGAFRGGVWRVLLSLLVVALFWGAVLGYVASMAYIRYGLPAGRSHPGVEPTEESASGEAADQGQQALEWVARGEAALAGEKWSDARAAFQRATELDPAGQAGFLGLARASSRLDLPDEAASAYDTVLRLAPAHLAARVEAAALARESGYLQRAQTLLVDALGSAPDDYGVRLEAARVMRASGNIDAASTHAQRLAELAPDDPRTALETAAIALARKSLEDAERGFRRAIDADGTLLEARVGLARVLALRGETSLALDHLQALAREFPDEFEPRLELAELLLRENDVDGAIGSFQKMGRDFPKRYHLRARHAELLVHAARYDEAYRVLQGILADRPGDAVAHMVLADLYLRRDLPSLADDHVTRALAQQPGDSRAFRLRCRIAMTQGRFDAALRLLRLLADAMPQDMELLLRLALCLEKTGDVEGAEVELERAIRLWPGTAAPHIQLAQLQARLERYPEAVENYRIALRREPENAALMNNLALALVERGSSPSEYIPLAEKAQRLRPADPFLADTLAWCYHLGGDSAAAEPFSAAAAKGMPDTPLIRYHRGVILAALGRRSEAKAELEAALAGGPSFKGAVEAEKLLLGLRQADETP